MPDTPQPSAVATLPPDLLKVRLIDTTTRAHSFPRSRTRTTAFRLLWRGEGFFGDCSRWSWLVQAFPCRCGYLETTGRTKRTSEVLAVKSVSLAETVFLPLPHRLSLFICLSLLPRVWKWRTAFVLASASAFLVHRRALEA